MSILNRVVVALAAIFMLNAIAPTVPAVGAPASPAATAKSAPKTKTKAKTVEGTVTKWSDATSSFQTKATIETWTFSYDKAKLQKVGTPAVGAFIKITYHMNGKSYVADKVVVEKKPTAKAKSK